MRPVRLLRIALLLAVLAGCGSPSPTATPSSGGAAGTYGGELATPAPASNSANSAGARSTVLPTTALANPTPEPPPAPAAPPKAIVRFTDDKGTLDAVVVTVSNVPRLADGEALDGWLVGGEGQPNLHVGRIPVGADGSAEVKLVPDGGGAATGAAASGTAAAPSGPINLLGKYSGFIITVEAAAGTPQAPSERIAFSGQLSGDALVHLRHLLVASDDTPNNMAQILGLRKQVETLAEHVEYQSVSLQNNNLSDARAHVEHTVNIIEGNQGKLYGDVFKDGQIQNPGDGYGLLENGNQHGYIDGVVHHATLAAAQAGAAADIRQQNGAAITRTMEAIKPLVQQLEQKQLGILEAKTVADALPLSIQSKGLADRIVNGFDANGNERIDPLEGEGGMLTAYQEAEQMATIVLAPGTALPGGQLVEQAATAPAGPAAAKATGAAPTTGASPSASPTRAGVTGSGAPASGVVTVEIRDMSFGPPLTVKAGSTIVWTNRDQVSHTVTADGGEFASDILKPGSSFGFTFSRPGTYPYFCELHGNRGGLGMAGTVTVVQ